MMENSTGGFRIREAKYKRGADLKRNKRILNKPSLRSKRILNGPIFRVRRIVGGPSFPFQSSLAKSTASDPTKPRLSCESRPELRLLLHHRSALHLALQTPLLKVHQFETRPGTGAARCTSTVDYQSLIKLCPLHSPSNSCAKSTRVRTGCGRP